MAFPPFLFIGKNKTSGIMENEIWKEIPGYNGRYLISENGKIYSAFLKKEMKQFIRAGYLSVRLCKKGQIKNFTVHSIVANVFIDNPNSFSEIDHIDGNKMNNRYSNLRYVSHKENMNNPITKEIRKSRIVEKQGIKIAVFQGEKFVDKFLCLMDAARTLNIPCTNISKQLRGKLTNVGGYTFERIAD